MLLFIILPLVCKVNCILFIKWFKVICFHSLKRKLPHTLFSMLFSNLVLQYFLIKLLFRNNTFRSWVFNFIEWKTLVLVTGSNKSCIQNGDLTYITLLWKRVCALWDKHNIVHYVTIVALEGWKWPWNEELQVQHCTNYSHNG